MEKRQLVIIGGGPAGLTAAIYGRRAGLDVLVLEKGMYGGQINITAEIENWPGVRLSEGAALARSFREHAEAFEPEFRDCKVESLSFDNGNKVVKTNKGEISADAIIIATGASFSHVGSKGEEEYAGRGVSYCAVCDGAFFEDLPVAVIGGGNTAVEEAGYLTQFASKVYIIHRREEFRADSVIVEKALANPKIETVMGYVVDEITGSDMVEGVRLRNLKTGETKQLAVDGVFVFVGTTPNVEYLGDLLTRVRGGWIVTNEHMETSEEGVFAAGDVRDKFLRQVVTATSDGAVAAMAAYEYISNQVYMEQVLFEPECVNAFFMSSIDGEHLPFVNQVEECIKEGGYEVVIVDGYRNVRMREKLGIKELPAIVELARGNKVREAVVSSLQEVKDFIDRK